MRKRIPWQKRLMAKVHIPEDWAEFDACWEWTGALIPKGYGVMTIERGKPIQYVHRLMWKMYHGDFPPNGLCVLHKCDNPKCVNINHLFVGTKADNNRDMKEKGRWARGEMKVMSSKLKESEVREIKKRLKKGDETHRSIAEDYPVNERTIGQIARKERWAWLVIPVILIGLFSCKKETVHTTSQDPYPMPTVLEVGDGYNARLLIAGDYMAQQDGFTTSSTGNPCCGSNFSLSVSQSGTDIDGDQSQQVNTGSGSNNKDTADEFIGEGGGGGQWVGGSYAVPVEGWGPPGGTPIEIVDGNGQWYLGVARDDLGGPNIPIDVSAPGGDVLTGYQSRRADGGNTVVLTYIAADGESVEKVVLKNQEWLNTGTAQY